MDCKFCKLEDISKLENKSEFRCSYCGYSFEASRFSILYDKMMQMPLNSWLLASILWFSAMVTGVLFGLGFNSGSLSTTILFLFMYGAAALLYGISTSLDMVQAFWISIKNIFTKEFADFEEIKSEVQKLRKKKIISELATGVAVDEATGTFIETDIRPGERRIPKLSPSFLAGIYTILLGVLFTIVFNVIFEPIAV